MLVLGLSSFTLELDSSRIADGMLALRMELQRSFVMLGSGAMFVGGVVEALASQ